MALRFLKPLKFLIFVNTLSVSVVSVQLAATELGEETPPLDLSKLEVINTSLWTMKGLVNSVDNSTQAMLQQLSVPLNLLGNSLVTFQNAVKAARSSPIKLMPEAILTKADNFIASANHTLTSIKEEVQSEVAQISSELSTIMPNLWKQTNEIYVQFQTSMGTVKSLLAIRALYFPNTTTPANSTESANSTNFLLLIQETLALARRASYQQRRVRHSFSTLDESVVGKGGEGSSSTGNEVSNGCQAATTAITDANKTLEPLFAKVKATNNTLISILLSSLDTVTSGLKQINSSIAPTVQAAADVGVPSLMLSPITTNLQKALATVDAVIAMVKDKIASIKVAVNGVIYNLADTYAESYILLDFVQEACLSGVCGAAAQAACEVQANTLANNSL